MKGHFPIERMQSVETPFYYYDTELLRKTLRSINDEVSKHDNFMVHYAIKANANPKILNIICQAGLGADCVSGGEIQACINAGFSPRKIVYAGVGKSDWEIRLALQKNILCLNVESLAELKVIEEIAAEMVAFANCEGGELLFGVKDKTGEILGLDYDAIQQTSRELGNTANEQVRPTIPGWSYLGEARSRQAPRN